MSTHRPSRRLAAILSADVAGFSRLVAIDEVGTLERLHALRARLGSRIEEHGGRVVDAVGDNLLAEFPSVVDAAECAVAAQAEQVTQQADLPAEHRLRFRIGVHLGDVVVSDTGIAGDGVNVAARVEGLAQPGGVALSGSAFDQVEGRLDVEIEDLGPQELKNIPRPVRVVRLASPSGSVLPMESLPGADELTAPGFGGRAAIAVLPFDNLSGDPEQDFFAGGLCEDLTARLSLFRDIPVIARNSTLAYKSRSVDLKQVSRDLGVRYVVEGSVRRADRRVRVTAQLVDATTGHHVWGERYDRELSDVFAVQDEIAEAVGAALGRTVFDREVERLTHADPTNLEAWEIALRGWGNFTELREETNEAARGLFERALKQDPRIVFAWVGLSMTHLYALQLGWSRDPAQDLSGAIRAAQSAIAIDDRNPQANVAMAGASMGSGRLEQALASAERAIELNPSFSVAYWIRGNALTILGRPDEGIESLLRAMRLSPTDTWLFAFMATMACAHMVAERYEAALHWAERSLQLRPDYLLAHHNKMIAQSQLGQVEAGRRTLARARRHDPDDVGIRVLLVLMGYGGPRLPDRVREALAKLGWQDL